MNSNEHLAIQKFAEQLHQAISEAAKHGVQIEGDWDFRVDSCSKHGKEVQAKEKISMAEALKRLSAIDVKQLEKSMEKARPITDTGTICDRCGGSRMLQTGTCLTCADCGTSVGGC